MTTPYSSYGNATAQSTFPSQTPPNPSQTSTHFTSVLSSKNLDQQYLPSPVRGRPRGSLTGAKRGRKPRGAGISGSTSPRPFVANSFSTSPTIASSGPSTTTAASAQYPRVHWALPTASGVGSEETARSLSAAASAAGLATSSTLSIPSSSINVPSISTSGTQQTVSTLDLAGLLSLSSTQVYRPPMLSTSRPGHVIDEDVEGEDELLPAMADDDYSAQLSWQSQSKDNLKVLMDNFSPAQYDRFESYRRHALPKQAVRKVIQKTLGQQVSQPVAQIIAGFSKVFVGEIVEKARAVQTRRGETGPLSPDHLREAYRAYQEQTGHVGAARPLRAKKLFVR